MARSRGHQLSTSPPLGPLARRVYHHPVGGLLLQADVHGLRMSGFHDEGGQGACDAGSEDGLRWLDQAERALDEYFAGGRPTFDFPCRPVGTEFQRTVWAALERIPFGHTTTYGTLAEKIGRPSAQRAVGAALGANPIPVIIPCHRVIGSSGSLVGFAGGLRRKRWLLGHESPTPALPFPAANPHSD